MEPMRRLNCNDVILFVVSQCYETLLSASIKVYSSDSKRSATSKPIDSYTRRRRVRPPPPVKGTLLMKCF